MIQIVLGNGAVGLSVISVLPQHRKAGIAIVPVERGEPGEVISSLVGADPSTLPGVSLYFTTEAAIDRLISMLEEIRPDIRHREQAATTLKEESIDDISA